MTRDRAEVAEASSHNRGGMSVNECQAARHLNADGWTMKELELAFERSSASMSHHLTGECDHPDVAPPKEVEVISGEELRDARLEAEMTQGDLAEYLGVSRGSISGWESGRRSPRPYRCREIRKALTEEGVDV